MDEFTSVNLPQDPICPIHYVDAYISQDDQEENCS